MSGSEVGLAASRVAVLQYGPVCGEYVAGGFQVVGVRFPPDLQDLTEQGALVVIGDPIVGFEHLIDDMRGKLPTGHDVIAVRPCHSTDWFWEQTSSIRIEEVAEPDVVIEECPRGRSSLLRAALSESAAGSPPRDSHHSGVAVGLESLGG